MIAGPLVLQDRDGCLAIFESVDEAIGNLDYDGVRDLEYTAYDSRGCLLAVTPAAKAVGTIEAVEASPGHERELRQALREAIEMRAPELASGAEEMPLPALLALASQLKRGFYLP